MTESSRLKSGENTEDISELFYLLNFFSQSYLEQWEQMPVDFKPVWFEGISAYCNVYSPVLFLFCIFADSIGCAYTNSKLSQELRNFLEDEMYVLVYDWMLERGDDELFSKDREIFFIGRSPMKIWTILCRLCKLALSYEDWCKHQLQELSFEHFLEKYAHPFDTCV